MLLVTERARLTQEVRSLEPVDVREAAAGLHEGWRGTATR
jgi:hypothetical protein